MGFARLTSHAALWKRLHALCIRSLPLWVCAVCLEMSLLNPVQLQARPRPCMVVLCSCHSCGCSTAATTASKPCASWGQTLVTDHDPLLQTGLGLSKGAFIVGATLNWRTPGTVYDGFQLYISIPADSCM